MVNTNCKKFKKNKKRWNRRKKKYVYIYTFKKSCYYFPPSILPSALRSAAMWHRPFSVPPWTQDAKSSGFMTCLVGNPNRLTFICHSYRVRIRSKQAKLSTVVLNVIDCVCVCVHWSVLQGFLSLEMLWNDVLLFGQGRFGCHNGLCTTFRLGS